MALNPRQILTAKLRLERRLTERLAEFFKGYFIAWADARTAGRLGPGAEQRTRLRQVFEAHYADVFLTFMPDAGQSDIGLAGLNDPHRARRFAEKASVQADLILARLSRELMTTEERNRRGLKMDDAGLESKADPVPTLSGKWSVLVISTLKEVGKAIKATLGTIANVNTQDIAEEAREADTMADTEGFEDANLVKVWNSVLDGRERPGHHDAHGQTRPVGEAFSVRGPKGNAELLRMPGDTSLGASLGNVINCRCWVDYFAQTANGERTPIGISTPRGRTRRIPRPGQVPGRDFPANPTSHFTFPTGKTRANIILGDGQIASATVRPGAITIRRNRRVIGSAQLIRNADGSTRLGRVTVDEAHRGSGIEGVLQRSVDETNKLKQLGK